MTISLRQVFLLPLIFLVSFIFGCSGKNEGDHPPIPDSPREHQGSGAPLFLFGSGQQPGPGATDEEYQEFLLWKEWQQYQKYQEWLRLKAQDGEEFNSDSESTSSDNQ